uniref:Uncharacterized protein n=1 Tax=Lotus japonicus TaxID=34305 RepID=I3T6G7_LOTJA|nr:unknown [Lotus japonicus]
MGLSSLPAPSEGVLCVILVNTAMSISIVKAIFRTFLHIVGIHVSSPSPPTENSQNPPDPSEFQYLSPQRVSLKASEARHQRLGLRVCVAVANNNLNMSVQCVSLNLNQNQR